MALVRAVSIMKIQTFAFILVTSIYHADTGRNLALGKPTSASSTYKSKSDLHTSSVVDGSTSGYFYGLSCHSTGSRDMAPWWQVDLQAVFRISRVRIVRRTDCCASRLHDLAIDVYAEDPAVTGSAPPMLCYYYKGVYRPTGQDTVCDSVVTGRFVRLSRKKTRPGIDIFTLCEVSIYEPVKYTAQFQKKSLSLSDVTVVASPLKMLGCAVACVTDPLCIAVKMTRHETRACQLIYKRVGRDMITHNTEKQGLTLSYCLVPTMTCDTGGPII